MLRLSCRKPHPALVPCPQVLELHQYVPSRALLRFPVPDLCEFLSLRSSFVLACVHQSLRHILMHENRFDTCPLKSRFRIMATCGKQITILRIILKKILVLLHATLWPSQCGDMCYRHTFHPSSHNDRSLARAWWCPIRSAESLLVIHQLLVLNRSLMQAALAAEHGVLSLTIDDK